MDRKEKIFDYISSDIYIPLKQGELAVLLDVPKSDYDEYNYIISSLIEEGKIYKTKKGKLLSLKNDESIFSGTLQCNPQKGFGFVRCDDEAESDIFIPSDKLGIAYDRDKVIVRIDVAETENSRREGHIVSVIKRGNPHIVGVLRCHKGKYRVYPDRREFFSAVRVLKDDIGNAQENDRVIVNIESYDEKGTPFGKVSAVLGNSEKISSILEGVISEKSVSRTFSKLVLDEAESLPDYVSEEEIKDRKDLRNKIIFTIDGDDSRDFDDAISLETLDNGNKLLGVHIADVSHYVREDSQLDKEALKRSTSVYFPHTVIPMLPKKLSNGICSLNPDVDRLTLSVMLELNSNADVVKHEIVKSVIHSKERLTYNIVNKILYGDTELRKEYGEITNILDEINVISKKLINKRSERGAIDFDFPETKIICDDDANPIDVKFEERGDSHRLIESCMLLANETVAETAFWSDLPFVYRVHEAPSNEKLTEFNEFIKNFGYSIKGKIDSETIHPKALQEIAEKVKGTPEEMMVSKTMLRSLMKACYRDTNDGHFGLAARYYCHFTSPIRRYPDLIIHRIIKDYISGKLNEEKISGYAKKVKEAAEISSEREVEAEMAERDAVDMLKAAYMQKFIGENFDAVVSSVTTFGIFAMLPNSCEGLIRYETMNGDYFEYNEISRLAVGIRTGESYKIGDSIRITVAAADILSRRIDFVREKDNSFGALIKVKRNNERKNTKPPRKQDRLRRKRRKNER